MPGKLPRLAFYFAFLAVRLVAQDAVRYELRFPNAAHHEAEIRATFSGVRGRVLEVVMSRSSPGRYALHEFAKNVYNFRAADAAGRRLQVTRPNPYQWNVEANFGAGGSAVVIDYTLFGDCADGTYNAIDPSHAHLNPPATFAWARTFEKNPASVKIEIPPGSDWTVATQLPPGTGETWTAPNLDALMDAPLEIGPHAMREWSAGDARFRLALHSQASEDVVTRFQRMAEAVVLEEEGVFGGFPKYDNGVYTFLVDYLPYVSGDGMEHRNSSVITSVRPLTRESAGQLIGSVAHEFFHSWNVKRIRPRSLEPFDYERVNMSGELWFAEGFTDYYAPLALTRAGLMPRDEFLGRVMGNAINTVLTAPGREVFSAADMSRRAAFTDGAVAVDPQNQANTDISYYTYGRALALGIDLAIRSRFPGKSLDDWMRAMWRRHPDVQKPYSQQDLEQGLAEATGNSEFAKEMFQRHIDGLEPMEYATVLARAGFVLQSAATGKAWAGTPQMSFSERGIDIGSALHGSPLYAAGIDRGDRIVEADGKALKTRQDFNDLVASHKPGDRSTLTVETRAGKKQVQIIWAEAPDVVIVSFEKAGRQVTPQIAAFREAWLGSKALRPLPKID
jgi:predicted metalloprotease with PDZ domain